MRKEFFCQWKLNLSQVIYIFKSMYGSINYDNKYELKVIETNCSSCGLSMELREGLPAYCPACLREYPVLLEKYRKYLKGTQIADLFYE